MKTRNVSDGMFQPLEPRRMMSATGAATTAPAVVQAGFDDSTACHKVVMQFNTDVSGSLAASDLVMVNTTFRQFMPADAIDVHYDAQNDTATFTFPGCDQMQLNDGAWRVSLPADAVTDTAGHALYDGVELRFVRFQGDVNHDGAVDLTDFSVLAANFNREGASCTQGDVDYDGRVDLSDFTVIAGRFNRTLSDVVQPPVVSDPAVASAPATGATTSPFSTTAMDRLSDVLA